ncbi:UMP kinase [archaeon]|jgi:uridylate kinase|nr:UMP kinase [archaeon]
MKKVVISLGGSVIVPNKVDYEYLKKFKKLISKFSKNNKVVIITGGGSTARDYIESVKRISSKDMVFSVVGIAATRLNARLVAGVFGKIKDIPQELVEVKNALRKDNLVICGALGMQPNMTSDGNAAEIAELIKADIFINITNVKGLYTSNPKTNKTAKFIPEISFEDFMKIVSKIKYSAGQHFVLDQSAAKIINRAKIKTYIVDKELKNIKKCLNGKSFEGTVISKK